MKKYISVFSAFVALSAFAEFYQSDFANRTTWSNAVWKNSSGETVETKPASGDDVQILTTATGYNDICSINGAPTFKTLKMTITSFITYDGNFNTTEDLEITRLTKENNGRLVAAVSGRSHSAFARNWFSNQGSFNVGGNLKITSYATDTGETLVNLGGRQSGEHQPNNFIKSLKVAKDLEIKNVILAIHTVSGADVEIAQNISFPENINGRGGSLILNSNYRSDNNGLLTQTIKAGGVSSCKDSAGVIATRTGVASLDKTIRTGVLEIIGNGGDFYGIVRDNHTEGSDASGVVSIIMNGTGKQTFRNINNSFTGDTIVKRGALAVCGSLGNITVEGGTFGAVEKGVKAKTLTLKEGGKLDFNLLEYDSSITLSGGLVLPDGANILDYLSFSKINGQYEFMLITDSGNVERFASLDGTTRVYTDSDGLSQTATFIYKNGGLGVKFIDAPKVERPAEPVDTSFKIVPLFSNGIVKVGEPFKFQINNPPDGATYKLTQNLGRKTVASGALASELELTLSEAGQTELVCEGVFESGSEGNAQMLHRYGFMASPEQVSTVDVRPADFDKYWAERKAEVEAVEPVMTLVLHSSQSLYDLYYFDVNCDGADLYGTDFTSNDINLRGIVATGYLAVPKNKAGVALPACVTYYGAGSYGADLRDATYFAERGIIGMSVSPHPVKQYGINSGNQTEKTLISQVQSPHYRDRCIDDGDPKKIYFNGMFKRVYQSLRAVMLMKSTDESIALPVWDGKNLAARGFSQGGAQTLAAAYLCPNVSVITPWCPAMADLGGMKIGRRSGWPDWINSASSTRTSATIYFDTALMSESTQASAYIGTGIIDNTCTPNAVVSAFNGMPSANKSIIYMQRTAHGITSAFDNDSRAFIIENFKANPVSKTTKPYRQWAVDSNLWGANALPNAKKDGADVSNLERYAFGKDFMSSAKANTSGKISLAYNTQSYVEGVSITPQWSTDLKNWREDGITISTSTGEDGSTLYEASFKTEPVPPIFFKLKLEQN